jgi:chorismate dehydratase
VEAGCIFARKIIALRKIKVAAVNYLNTKPLLYGFRSHEVSNQIELLGAYPAQVAEWLINDEVDIALVPVAVIPKLKEHHIVSEFGIGCDGAVASVCLFSDVPLEKVEKVYLDYQSRTSVQLAKILLKEYWKSKAELIVAPGETYRNEIKGTTAGLVIGDRALQQRLQSKYIYDLGEAWKAHTGLPFLFAAWISNKSLPLDFIKAFNEANSIGLLNIDTVVSENPYDIYDLKDYYTNCISYKLDLDKKKALQLFLSKLPL